MKKLYLYSIVVLMMLLLFAIPGYAVKAFQGIISVTQPDGTHLNMRLNGDEFQHYRTTEDGFLIKESTSGYYKYATVTSTGQLLESTVIARNPTKRSANDLRFLKSVSKASQSVLLSSATSTVTPPLKAKSTVAQQNAFPLTGSGKSLVILVNFSDNAFSVSTPATAFTNLLNQTGYSTNGGTGSAKDYFLSSSYGKFSPVFDVVGPYTLPNTLAYYGTNDGSGNDQNPRQMVIDACTKASQAGVNFSQYDTNSDGYVDNVFIYYAGYNEAEGGATTTVWPHRWALANNSTVFNGKIVSGYACTSELRSNSGVDMCGIGTFCHEFGHVLGLPDYYYTTSPSKTTLGSWSIMDYGSYSNSGRTPPTYSCYDRFFLGWLTPQQANTASDLTLLPLYQGTTQPANTLQQSYLLSATTHNLNGASPSPSEFFMVEYRQKTGWDTYLPSEGMCIWHVDFNQTAWTNNTPNNYTGTSQTAGSHMRVYLQPLSGSTTTPGDAFTTGSFTPTTWAGTDINRVITEITKSSNNVIFKLMGGGTLATVSTTSSSSISATTVVTGGNVTSDGNAVVTACGVCWAATSGPTISNFKTVDGSGTGNFASTITGFTAGTLYYVRAYATNNVGTAYGNEISFIYTNTDKNITDITTPSACDVAVASGNRFTTNTSGQTVHSISVQPGGTLDLTNNVTITGDVILKSDNSSSFTANVGNGAAISGTLKYIKTVDDAHWYFLSFPCNVLISTITKSDGSSLGTLGTDWFIQSYNGSTRVSNLGAVSNWNNIVNTNLSLQAYTGYALGIKTGVGPFDVLFPLQKSLLTSESARTVPVVAYGSGTSVPANNIGWNLVGQPYLSKYAVSNAGVNYMTFPADATAQTYTTTDLSSPKLLDPFTAFFVQADAQLEASQISFATIGRQAVSAAVRQNITSNVQLNISTATGNDKTNLVLDDSGSTDYVIGQDIEKWMGIGTAKPQIYTVLGGVNYSYNSLPANKIVNLPVDIYTQTSGLVTIDAISTNVSGLSQLILTDKLKNINTNLLTSSYNFDATAGTTTNRFVLNSRSITTKYTQDNDLNNPEVSTNKGNLVINNLQPGTTIKVFDAIGRLVFAEQNSTQYSMKFQLPTQGLFVVTFETKSQSWKYKVLNSK